MNLCDMATVVSMSSVTASILGGFDEWVWRQFVHHPFLTGVAKNITDFGTLPVLLPVAILCGVLVWWRYRSILLAMSPWFALQLNSVVTGVLKRTFDVARPPHSQWLAGAAGGSFPSGHTANTTCLLVALAAIVFVCERRSDVQRAAIVTAAMGSVIMGWTRLALNVHWLSDVLAGWLVGMFFGIGVVYATFLLHRASDKSHR